ncbi:MAG: ferrous iron transport protein B [Christensenellales bacterium]|jgi:ferrous iron transport protein B
MRFALAGNPNSGKTTLFNSLTGSTAHVGNWPGVTVDRKEGVYKKLKEHIDIIDLPGIYSLSPYTPEEVIARNYIIDDNPDLIINIVDATNLERNLYLTTQLLETDCPVVVALNMIDAVKKDGASIDVGVLEAKLGVPVIAISALRDDGVKELMEAAYDAAKKKRKGHSVVSESYMGEVLGKITEMLSASGITHPVFHAVKLLEEDELEMQHVEAAQKAQELKSAIKLDEALGGDFEAGIADIRYRYITANLSKALVQTKKRGELTRSDKIDKVLTNKYVGIPIFLAFMFIVFHTIFSEDFLGIEAIFGGEAIPSLGVWLGGLAEELIALISDGLASLLMAAGASDWVLGLVIDGVVAGVGAVLGFLPLILLLFLFLSIMEDTGYMARVAFLMDRVLRRFGLSGKAFLPMLMGFGCSVPAMANVRTLADDKERKLTLMLMPFFSCGAKLPVWAMIAGAIFPGSTDLVVFGIYVLGILVAVIASMILKKTLLKGAVPPFIMELPTYRLPQIRNLFIHLWDKLKHFVVRATTIIAGSTVVIWFLSNFSFTLEMVDANSAQSILGVIGNFIRPIFVPLGWASGDMGWRAVVATLTGLIAKEMVVSTMGVLYNPGVEGDALEDEAAATALTAALAATFSPLAAISFMAFNLLSVPCMAAVAAASAELNSRKWTWITIGFWMLTAWVVSFLIFNVGSLLGLA